jgi:hypothetical protein
MPITCEEIAIEALARAAEFGAEVPATRSLMYRRIGVRQAALFAEAGRVNQDYYGVCAIATLDNGAADLADIADPIPPLEAVTRVEVFDAGTSGIAAGTEINLVTLNDQDAATAPRMTLRNNVLRAVGADLDDVVSVEVYYSRSAKRLGATDANTNVELQAPWDELLVVDLTRYLLRKAISIKPDVRAAALELLDGEEAEMMAGFIRHVAEYAPYQTRFGRPPFANREAK